MTYTVHEAKTNLSKILKEVEAGKEVTISRGKKPVARIVPVETRKPQRRPGTLKGKLWEAPDAWAPMSEEDLRDWGLA